MITNTMEGGAMRAGADLRFDGLRFKARLISECYRAVVKSEPRRSRPYNTMAYERRGLIVTIKLNHIDSGMGLLGSVD